ncbi:MAG: zinc ribbon domain-containing protein, partial [Lachnospiraceae bacterium]|nr:zinc ribbon domain-containing protein [Lachnospiraceae bacterium]
GVVWFRVLHGMSMTSYGEKITITLRPMGSGTDVHILSECGLPTQIVDYGKNAKNCAAIFAYLERDIPQQGAMQPAPGIPVQPAPVRQAEQPGYPQAPAYQQAPAQPQAPVQPQIIAAAAFAAQDFVFCPECGTKNSKSAKFCMNCGTRLIIPQ